MCSTLSIVHVTVLCGAPVCRLLPVSVLFTRVNINDTLAHFALYETTPMELAVTTLRQFSLARVVAAVAAHQTTPAHVFRCLVASSTYGTEGSRLGVRKAVVRRMFQVHEVFLVHFSEARVGSYEFRAASVEADAHGAVVTLAKSLADETEVRQLVPARLQAARPRHAVALACDLRVAIQRLQQPHTERLLLGNPSRDSMKGMGRAELAVERWRMSSEGVPVAERMEKREMEEIVEIYKETERKG